MASPLLQALLLADQVYQDRTTGKHVICGVFSAVYFTPTDQRSTAPQPQTGDTAGAGSSESPRVEQSSVPVQKLMKAGSPYAYISLTEIQGTRKFELRYVELFENTAIFSTQFQVKSKDRLATIELTVPLPLLPAEREGAFALELLCENELLGSHRVRVKQTPDN